MISYLAHHNLDKARNSKGQNSDVELYEAQLSYLEQLRDEMQ